MSNEIVIKVEGVGKKYQLGEIGSKSLSEDIRRLFINKKERSSQERINEFWALRDVSFNLVKGDVLGIVGKNGAGKSTLLKILSRITKPSLGNIKIKGRMASLLEVGTGFNPDLTGFENIYMNGTILGMSKQEIRRKFDEIVEFSGVQKFINTPVKKYSSGMYVRLAFAVAAHLEPEILIVDEVLSVGDAEFQKRCLGKMQDVAGNGRTVIFVSHNLTSVRTLCSRGILLKQGRLLSDASPSEIIDQYLSESEEVYGGEQSYPDDPSMAAQIVYLSILDKEGRPSGRVDMTQPFRLRVKYRIRESIPGLTAGCSLTEFKETIPLLAINEAELDPSRLKTRPAGFYTSDIIIPPNLLNSGKFKLKAGLTAQKHIYNVTGEVCFNVFDGSGVVQDLGYERKNAILSMSLPWHTEYSPL